MLYLVLRTLKEILCFFCVLMKGGRSKQTQNVSKSARTSPKSTPVQTEVPSDLYKNTSTKVLQILPYKY